MMRKIIACGALIALVLLLVCPTSSEAHGHVSFSFGIPLWVGPGPWWGPYPYYYPAPPMAVQPPTVYEQAAPPVQAPTYWYYCPNPQGYYPYIQQCPNGWMQVVPPTTPPR